jgi:nitroreductase
MSDPASLPAKDVTTLLRRVRQTRDFRADPVPEDALLDILDVARWTGSVSNSQPWTFIVVTDSEARRKMAEAAPYTAHIGVAPVVIVIAHDDSGNLETDNYDEGRLTERIMTAATAHGLACGLARAREGAREVIRDLLGVPQDLTVRSMVSIGYPTDAGAKPKSAPGQARRPLESFIRRERFS